MFLDRLNAEIPIPAEAEVRRGASEQEGAALLYARHKDDVLHFCLGKLGNYDDAADIVQEAFYRFLRKPNRECVQKPRAFLFETARNLIRDKYRIDQRQKKKAHVALELVSDRDLVCPSPSAESEVQSREAIEMALEALADLPPKCQAVFVMKLYHGYSYEEIATKLDITSVVGVKKYMMRALGHLRDSMDVEEMRTGCEPAADLPTTDLSYSETSVNEFRFNGVTRQIPQAAE